MFKLYRRDLNQTLTSTSTEVVSKLQINFLISDVTHKNLIKSNRNAYTIRSKAFSMMVGKIKTKWCVKVYPNFNGSLLLRLENLWDSSSNYKVATSLIALSKEQTILSSGGILSNRRFIFSIDHSFGHDVLLKRFDELVPAIFLNFQLDIKLTAPASEGEIFFAKSIKVVKRTKRNIAIILILGIILGLFAAFYFETSKTLQLGSF